MHAPMVFFSRLRRTTKKELSPCLLPNKQQQVLLLLYLTRLFTKLRRYGISGILSYGLLNTVYYLTTFFFVWFYIAPAPGRLGYVAAVERFLKVMAMVWVGSQVTKLARAAGALAFAPLVSRGLTWFTRKFKFESEGKAFMAIAGFCFGLALLLFFSVTLLWA
ncbi:Gag-Pol polyprotein/retrotransposon [Thalictrum thalictroides]|uniref:Gag-Pol polyprotein/retrotransposon n=1 Tax=Thalictrum thalictroides TaxID=46969 RepID=A0A7J6VGA3_THATH|nr:Gag-Pol polyprotein/retrotransposon [Thalictrum thalictroides]